MIVLWWIGSIGLWLLLGWYLYDTMGKVWTYPRTFAVILCGLLICFASVVKTLDWV